MSNSLYWYKPPSEKQELGGAGHPLKGILARRFYDNDGSLVCGKATISLDRDGDFLRGLVAGDISGAQKLLEDLERYGSVEIEIHE